MQSTSLYSLLLLVTVIMANLPWLTERFLMVFAVPKKAFHRWLESLIYFILAGGLGLGMEYLSTGANYHQSWEFVVANVCLFIVFGLPGFIYHYDLKPRFLKTDDRS